MKIAIIGAGAAGIIAAITAKRKNKNLQIDMFEANNSIGKKILASGNGRCNISNTATYEQNYLGQNPEFVNFALKEFDFKKFETFCKSIGLFLDIKPDGKVYPLSNEAKSVVKLLQLVLENLGVNIFTQTFIKDIEKNDNKFDLFTKDNNIFKSYDKILISNGLGAAPQLNANESGLDFAQKLNHSFSPTYPSLVGLHTNCEYKTKLQGLKKQCKVTLYINNVKEQEIFGDVLFTKYGVSGFAILDISQLASYYLSLHQKVKISINFFPDISKNDFADKIQTLFKQNQNIKVIDILTGIISNKLSPVLLSICKIDPEILTNNISAKQIKTIAYQLNSWEFNIVDTQGFKHAEASGGGVLCSEINNKTFESKKTANLYFAGEVIDIVGNRGGYNLHFAWASGYIAGKNLSL